MSEEEKQFIIDNEIEISDIYPGMWRIYRRDREIWRSYTNNVDEYIQRLMSMTPIELEKEFSNCIMKVIIDENKGSYRPNLPVEIVQA